MLCPTVERVDWSYGLGQEARASMHFSRPVIFGAGEMHGKRMSGKGENLKEQRAFYPFEATVFQIPKRRFA